MLFSVCVQRSGTDYRVGSGDKSSFCPYLFLLTYRFLTWKVEIETLLTFIFLSPTSRFAPLGYRREARDCSLNLQGGWLCLFIRLTSTSLYRYETIRRNYIIITNTPDLRLPFHPISQSVVMETWARYHLYKYLPVDYSLAMIASGLPNGWRVSCFQYYDRQCVPTIVTALIYVLSLLSVSPRGLRELYKYSCLRIYPCVSAFRFRYLYNKQVDNNFIRYVSGFMLHNELYYFIKWKQSTTINKFFGDEA